MQPWQRLLAQVGERLRIAKEQGLVGGHRLDHLARQLGIVGCPDRAAQALGKRTEILQTFPSQQGSEPGFHQVKLVRPEG